MKRAIPILIVAALIFSVSVIMFTDDNDSAAAGDGGLHVNGHYVTGQHYSVDEGTEHWTYDYNSGTLTIDADSVFSSYYYYDSGYQSPCSYGIYQGGGGGINLILNGDLVIEGAETGGMTTKIGMYTVGNFTISGPGKLTIKPNGDFHYNEGLTANGSITIDGATVEIHSSMDLYAGDGYGGNFNMNSGELNLLGSGTAVGDSVYIKGGIINIDGSQGSDTNEIYAHGHDNATLDMSGGAVYFKNVNKGDAVMFCVSMYGTKNLDLHGATGTNWVVKDGFVDAVDDGPLSITINSSFPPKSNVETEDNVVIGITVAVAVAAFGILLMGFIGKKY